MIKCKITYKFQTKVLYHWKGFGSQNFEEHIAIQHWYIGIICSTYTISNPALHVHVIMYGYRHTFFFSILLKMWKVKNIEDVNSYNGWICKTLFRSDAWLVGVLWRGVVRGVSVPQAGLVRRGWFISEVI